MYNEYAHETIAFESNQFEYNPQEYGEYETGGLFSHEQELALAQELLTVNSEAELDRFLGDLIRQAGSAVGRIVSSPTGQAIGSTLKGTAQAALNAGMKGGNAQAVGKAAGSYLGGKAGSWAGGSLGSAAGQRIGNYLGGRAGGQYLSKLGQTYGSKAGNWLGSTLGGKLGGSVANWASGLLGNEAESMEQEEYEFIGAQHFVRLASEIAGQTLQAPPNIQPRAAAQAAANTAVRQFMPGLFAAGGAQQSGRWVRQGNRITLYGV